MSCTAPGRSQPAGPSGLAEQLRAALARELDGAVMLRRELHANPELSGSEIRTAARVAEALGAPDAPVVGGTGRLVRIGPQTGSCVAIRAELDALPIAEQTGVPWSSRNGAMHACGHDVHLAALTALGNAARRVRLPTALLAVLQPREETFPSGARDIVAADAFGAQQAQAVVGVHLQHQLPAGTVGASAGTVNAATDDFEIQVEGVGGHAGYPHLAIDPVPALCQTVLAVQQIISRHTDPTHAVVASFGMLEAGQAPNVIPGTAHARGSLRALDESDRPGLHKSLHEIVGHTCRAHGCRGTVTIFEGEPALVNDDTLAAASWPWLQSFGFAVDTGFRSCGADDFSFYARSAPTLMLFLGTGGEASLHHPGFLPGDDNVRQVAEAMLAGYLGALGLGKLRPGPRLAGGAYGGLRSRGGVGGGGERREVVQVTYPLFSQVADLVDDCGDEHVDDPERRQEGIERRYRLNCRGQHEVGNLGYRREPGIGHEDHRRPARASCPGELDRVPLVAAEVERHQHVPLGHVEGMTQLAKRAAVDQAHPWPNLLEMADEVLCQPAGESSSYRCHRALHVC